MAVTAKTYGQLLLKALNKEVSCANAGTNLKCMLCTSSYVPDQDNHYYKSHVTNEITGTGYTAGGATLTSLTVAYNSSTNVITIDAADTAWSGATFTFRYAVIYDSTSTNQPLIAYVDFGADTTVNNGTLTIQWDAAGICTITVA